jgi:hypothetical protein
MQSWVGAAISGPFLIALTFAIIFFYNVYLGPVVEEPVSEVELRGPKSDMGLVGMATHGWQARAGRRARTETAHDRHPPTLKHRHAGSSSFDFALADEKKSAKL